MREQFRRNMVGWLPGEAYFEDDHTVTIEGSRRARSAPSTSSSPSARSPRGRTRVAVRRPHDHRLRRPAEARPAGAAHDDGRRRRRDRRRVRVDVRRARHQGHAWSTSATGRSTSSTARSARRSSTCCAAQRDLPPAREGRRRSSRSTAARGSELALGQGDRLRDGALRGRAPGRDGRSRDREHRARGRQARADRRSTTTTARRCRTSSRSATSPAAGWRRPRWSRADRRAARVRPAGPTLPALSRPASTRSPRSAWSARTEEELTDCRRAVRGRDRALDRARARADDRRRGRHAQAARRPEDGACSACT